MSGSRESNIEILRIISIIAITLYHNSIWGGYDFDDVTINKILIESLSMFGKIGSNLFILITGYFSIKKFSVKKIIQIEMQTVFFSWTLLIISLFWIDINIKDIVKNILPTVFGNYWFPTAFIIWGLFIPYINKLCILLKKRELGSMIFFCICVWFVVPCITFNQEGFGLNNYMSFPIMYIMGVYLRLFPIQCGIKWGGVVVLLIMIQAGFPIIVNMIGGKHIHYSIYLRNGNSVTGLMLTLALFVYFSRVRGLHKTWINKLSTCTFTMYLIQEHILFREIMWQRIFRVSYYQDHPFLFIFLSIDIMLLYFMSFICTIIYQKIEKILLPIVSKNIKKYKFVKMLEEI